MGVLENLRGVVVRNLLDKEQLAETAGRESLPLLARKWSFLTVHMVERETNQLSPSPLYTSRIEGSATNPTWSDIDIRQPKEEGAEAQRHRGDGLELDGLHDCPAQQRALQSGDYNTGEFGLRIWSCVGKPRKRSCGVVRVTLM
jgi:hypothetical protein